MFFIQLRDLDPRGNLVVQQLLWIVAGLGLVAWLGSADGIWLGLWFILPTVVAITLGASRGRTGWMWGFFLSWLGVLILACMRPQVSDA